MIFANSLDPDQAKHCVGPDLDPNHLTLIVFLKEICEKSILKKWADDQNIMKKLPSMQRVNKWLKAKAQDKSVFQLKYGNILIFYRFWFHS